MIAAGYAEDGTIMPWPHKMPSPVHTPARQQFFEYAARVKEAQEFREKNLERTWAATWWAGHDTMLKNCLIGMIVGGDWARYEGMNWSALPPDLRDDLMLLGRTIERSFRGAPWR